MLHSSSAVIASAHFDWEGYGRTLNLATKQTLNASFGTSAHIDQEMFGELAQLGGDLTKATQSSHGRVGVAERREE